MYENELMIKTRVKYEYLIGIVKLSFTADQIALNVKTNLSTGCTINKKTFQPLHRQKFHAQ